MKKRVGLAVNWFNYPICLSQAWFRQSCNNCGKRWQTLTWRRSTTTAAVTTATGASTCPPRHRQRTHSSTSMPPPTASTWVTREKGKSHLQGVVGLLLLLFSFICMWLARFVWSHDTATGKRFFMKPWPQETSDCHLALKKNSCCFICHFKLPFFSTWIELMEKSL